MKIDMSPKAVTQRLRMLDQLWQLNTKLATAGKKKVKKVSVKRTIDNKEDK
jgi:hypothetical protein